MDLNTSIKELGRVGVATAKKLKKLGINNVRDLLFYFPFRYDDFSNISKIKDIKPDTSVNVVGEILLIQNKKSFKKKIYITEALLSDGDNEIKIIWFNQPFIAKNIKTGDKISVSGKVDHNLALKSPIFEKISSGKTIHSQGLVPNYHLTAGLSQKQIRFLVNSIIHIADDVPEWISADILKENNLVDLKNAIKKFHFPNTYSDIEIGKKRLAFGELLLLQLQSQISKLDLTNKKADKIKFYENETKQFVESLPFKLTNAQRRAAWQIIKDIGGSSPMTRLLEGDVGSGKTVVACLPILNAYLNNKQSALMVPTEILALQHFESIKKLFSKLNIKIALLTRAHKELNFDKKATKTKILKLISQGDVNLVIGTHAIVQDSVLFNNLSLAIVDEQHRFGVKQRKKLLEKCNQNKNETFPHLLSMTATPIPRSLALAIYGDLKISIIDELPEGRLPIITKVIEENNRKEIYEFVKNKIKDGRQVFVICPLIDYSDKIGVKSAKEEYEKLKSGIFPNINIGLLHGRLSTEEKTKTMEDFKAGKTKILVSTSVVEVGVDIPNASIMIIEGADRFGLSQLHQFRGRIGRGKHQSHCLLFTDSSSAQTSKRLNALTKNNDGFSLAKIDLKFRGPGEIFGIAQKGFPELKIASLSDLPLINKAKNTAEKIFCNDKTLSKHPQIKKEMKKLENDLHFE